MKIASLGGYNLFRRFFLHISFKPWKTIEYHSEFPKSKLWLEPRHVDIVHSLRGSDCNDVWKRWMSSKQICNTRTSRYNYDNYMREAASTEKLSCKLKHPLFYIFVKRFICVFKKFVITQHPTLSSWFDSFAQNLIRSTKWTC